MGLLDMGIALAIGKIRDNVINPKLAGIGRIEDLSYKGGQLHARIRLEELEEHPLEITCEDINIAEDGSKVRIGRFKANKKFMQTALDQYLAGKPIAIPEGGARLALAGAKKLLGI